MNAEMDVGTNKKAFQVLEIRRVFSARLLPGALHQSNDRSRDGVLSLMEIFDEKYYLDLEGGILEALGRMFKSGLKLYVYPMIDEKASAS